MKKTVFVHQHDKGSVNVPVLQHEIQFCNENSPGKPWYFNTSPYWNRYQRRQMDKAKPNVKYVPNNRAVTEGRSAFRLAAVRGILFAKKMVTHISNLKKLFINTLGDARRGNYGMA